MRTIRSHDTYRTELLFKITIKGTIRNPKGINRLLTPLSGRMDGR
nr:MAG TPA: hypothetical protein [Caudoviricetes sp.]